MLIRNLELILVTKINKIYPKLLLNYFSNLNYAIEILNLPELKKTSFSQQKNYCFIFFHNDKNLLNVINKIIIGQKIYDSACLLLIISKSEKINNFQFLDQLILPTQIITDPLPVSLIKEKLKFLENFLLLKKQLLKENPKKATANYLLNEKKQLFNDLFHSLNHEFRNALTPIYLSSIILNKYKNDLNSKEKKELMTFMQATADFAEKVKDLDVILKNTILDYS